MPDAAAEPLGARFEPARARGAAKLSAVSYASGGARVRGWWVAPEGPGPHAGLVFQHWGFGSRDSFLAEALALARSGVVALLPNTPGYGGRAGPRPLLRAAERARAYAERAVRDLRRGLDLLCAQAGVDRARLGFVGHSLGASVGGPLLGADARPAAAVLVGGSGAISRLWLPRASEAERAALAPLDGTAWIGRTRAACLFQYGERDEFIPRDDAAAYAAAAPGAEARALVRVRSRLRRGGALRAGRLPARAARARAARRGGARGRRASRRRPPAPPAGEASPRPRPPLRARALNAASSGLWRTPR